MDSVPTGETWIHEMKYDGYRMQAHVQKYLAQLYTRNGHEWSNKFPFILKALEDLPLHNAVFDGEIVALDEKGRPEFQDLQNSIKAKDDKRLRYYIFDLLYLNGVDLREEPLLKRKELLEEVLKDPPEHLIYSQHLLEKGEEFFRVSCEHSLEGVVSKLSDSPYRSGRSDLWVKTKCQDRQEFVIGGFTSPKGGRSHLGALLLGLYIDDKFQYVGKVGTGFNQKTLKSIHTELKKRIRKTSPFEVKSPKESGAHWVTPELVCEVSFSNWTQENILRTPVFLGMREDKKAKEVHMDKAKNTKHLNAVREITSPDKILFKKDKKTKQDVSDFYQKIAKEMLPYMENRPLSLVRCPEGGSGKCFFQKHIHGETPESFKTFEIKEEKGSGTYLAIDSSAGLQELVQLNAFEIHAWNSHYESYMYPDQIVMDFDPGPGVSFKEVIDGALELKDMLSDLGLESFVKVTGGKGLHVHVPIEPIYSWEQIKGFCEALAKEMESREPKKFLSNMSKKLRKNKIFVDYLRNGYGATAVVPYSLRAKEHSAVALPVDWGELKRIKSADQFTIDKALSKIKRRKKDPWSGMLDLKQKIPILDALSSQQRDSA